MPVTFNLIYEGKASAYPQEIHREGRLLVLNTNIRLWWMWLTVAYTLAYYDAEFTTVVFFAIPGVNVIKHCTAFRCSTLM
jgi:hypothetical protein